MNKPKQIKKIEAILDLELDYLKYNEYDGLSWAYYNSNKRTYNLNSGGEIISLNISYENIINFDFIRSLKKLKFLNLEGNEIEDISFLANMKELQYLSLENNRILEISVLNKLKNLEILKLGDNIINIFPELHLPKLKELSLYGNYIEDISPLNKLNLLTILDISVNNINDISILSSFTNLIFLDASKNNISDISEVKKLKKLKQIYFADNEIFDLSPLYHFLMDNIIIGMIDNPLIYPPYSIYEKGIDSIVDWFDQNFKLANHLIDECIENKNKKLDLGCCGLTDLTLIPKLFECVHLEELILSNTYPEFDKNKRVWNRIDSSNTGLKNNLIGIPKNIIKLKNLKILIAGGDWKDEYGWNRGRIRELGAVTGLKNLEYLNLSNNIIKKITSLKKLSALKVLHLNNNKIQVFYHLYTHPSLEELYISNNFLKKVDFLTQLLRIHGIDLHGNEISDLRPIKSLIERIGITENKWLTDTICIQDNPLTIPDMDFVRLGKEAVLNIISQTSKGKFFYNNDIKLILVGNSESGKTTLTRYLCNDNYIEKPPYTLWLDEYSTIINDTNIRIFDFGGHDFYHDTHHIFFSDNALYLLLWDTETNKLQERKLQQNNSSGNPVNFTTQDYPIKYWLESIEFYIKEKQVSNFNFEVFKDKQDSNYSSHVLIVQNKVENNRNIDFLNNRDLKIAYKFIFDFINLDIHTGRNLENLMSLIKELLSKANILKSRFPEYYKLVKDKLTDYKGEAILTLEKFHEFCNKISGVNINIEDTEILAKYLDAIGTILYHDSNREYVYIDKKYISILIANVFSGLNIKHGEFDIKYLNEKIPNTIYSKNVIALLKQFKLIFQHPENKNYIAPLYLPSEPPEGIKLFLAQNDIPYRRFSYEGFIHKRVILDLFQEYGRFTLSDENKKNFYYWKDGLIVKDSNSGQIVLIEFNLGNEFGNAYIDVNTINGVDFKNEFLNNIIEFIKVINSGYVIEEMVTVNGIDFVSINLLNSNYEKGKIIFNERKPSDLNNGIKYEKDIYLKDYRKFLNNRNRKMKKVFISYSKKDETMVNTFLDHLSSLHSEGLVESWYCTELNAGEDWDKKIKEKLEEADIVCFMISHNFMATPYIHKFEVKNAFVRSERGDEIKIVPIILDYADWSRQYTFKGKDGKELQWRLNKFTALPFAEKEIKEFKNENKGWYVVINALRAIIQDNIETKDIDEDDVIRKFPPKIQEIYQQIKEGKV